MNIDRRVWRAIDGLARIFPAPGRLAGVRYGWIMPALSVAYVAAADYVHQANGRVTMAPMFLILTQTVYFSGFWPGLAVAAITAVMEWHFWPGEIARNLIVGAVMFSTLIVTAVLQRKAQILDSLDSNVLLLAAIREKLDYVLDDWEHLSRAELQNLIGDVRGDVRALLTRGRGWLELSQHIKEVRQVFKK